MRRLLGVEIPSRSAPRLGRLRRTVALELGLLTVFPFLGTALHYGLG